MTRLRLKGPLGVSLAASLLIAMSLVVRLPPMFTSLVVGGPGAVDDGMLEGLLAQHDDVIRLDLQRFAGRSVFFTPPQQPRPRPVVPEPDPEPVENPEPVEDPGPPPPPSSYTGPAIIAILGDEAWFRRSFGAEAVLRIRVGEERDGIRVLATEAPWTVRLAHAGGEYDVPVFHFESPFLREDPPTMPGAPGLIDVLPEEDPAPDPVTDEGEDEDEDEDAGDATDEVGEDWPPIDAEPLDGTPPTTPI